MSFADVLGIDMEKASERSAVYRTLAESFSYRGAQSGPFPISGAEYTEAFDPAVHDGACSLREGAHIEDDQSALFEELMRFYEFFGLSREEGAEIPDHICVQLEFMHYLTYLEDQVDTPEDLASIQRAQFDFLSRHLGRLIRAVHGKLKSECESCINLVQACYDFVSEDMAFAKARAEA